MENEENIRRKSHARIDYNVRPSYEPNPTPDPNVDRDLWIETVSSEFVSPSKANKEYYRVILETLWPKGHGIPGPVVSKEDIREAISKYRGKTYQDPFRRMRELQGEEGFLGIIKVGNDYQLVDLTVSEKREPRQHLSEDSWQVILRKYDGICAACGRTPDEDGFQQDHKIPRLRGGGDDIDNWQPLCDACNNMKSTACRDCKEDCSLCCWAFPEKYKPLRIPGPLIERLRIHAKIIGESPDQIVVDLLTNELDSHQE